MFTRTRRAALLAILCACLCLSLRGIAQAPSGPVVTLGLADPASFSKVLPLPAPLPDGSFPVHPIPAGQRGAGMVIFRAELFGTTAPVQCAMIQVPRGSGCMFSTPTMHTFIGAGWDTRQVESGTVAQVTVTAIDTARHQSVQTILVTLQK